MTSLSPFLQSIFFFPAGKYTASRTVEFNRILAVRVAMVLVRTCMGESTLVVSPNFPR